jgi:DNA polymerase/3'-5' exonuclease PolX
MDNAAIAHELLRQARELAAQGDNLYRVRAYRRAAAELFGLATPVSEIVAEGGPRGLKRLPGVGPSLAKTIAELAGREPEPARAHAG